MYNFSTPRTMYMYIMESAYVCTYLLAPRIGYKWYLDFHSLTARSSCPEHQDNGIHWVTPTTEWCGREEWTQFSHILYAVQCTWLRHETSECMYCNLGEKRRKRQSGRERESMSINLPEFHSDIFRYNTTFKRLLDCLNTLIWSYGGS